MLQGIEFKLLKEQLRFDITQLIGERSRGFVLWRWFIIAALLFLIIEAFLLRFWKV